MRALSPLLTELRSSATPPSQHPQAGIRASSDGRVDWGASFRKLGHTPGVARSPLRAQWPSTCGPKARSMALINGHTNLVHYGGAANPEERFSGAAVKPRTSWRTSWLFVDRSRRPASVFRVALSKPGQAGAAPRANASSGNGS
jgi:hypothetical protein